MGNKIIQQTEKIKIELSLTGNSCIKENEVFIRKFDLIYDLEKVLSKLDVKVEA